MFLDRTTAEPVPRRLVSANFDNASRIRDLGSVRIFGHDGHIADRREEPPVVEPVYPFERPPRAEALAVRELRSPFR